MTNNTINITVVIPTHNRPEKLHRAVKSVLGQTRKDFEVIVVDDGAIRTAESVVARFEDKRLVYLPTKGDTGASHARNCGIDAARGSLVMLLDDDDECTPDRMERQASGIERNHNVSFSFCRVRNLFHDEEGAVAREKEQIINIQTGTHDFYSAFLGWGVKTVTSTVMARRDALVAIGGFDPSFLLSEERNLLLQLARKGLGYYDDACLVVKHNTAGGENLGANLSHRIQGRERIINHYWNDFKKRPDALRHNYIELAYFYNKAGMPRTAGKYLFKAWLLGKADLSLLLRAVGRFILGRLYNSQSTTERP